MTQKEFNAVITDQMERCRAVLMQKGSEYAAVASKNPEADRLAHFKRAAVVMNVLPKAVLMGMLSKHLISVSDMCMNEEIYPEKMWEEKITDSINYFLILRALAEEEQNAED